MEKSDFIVAWENLQEFNACGSEIVTSINESNFGVQSLFGGSSLAIGEKFLIRNKVITFIGKSRITGKNIFIFDK